MGQVINLGDYKTRVQAIMQAQREFEQNKGLYELAGEQLVKIEPYLGAQNFADPEPLKVALRELVEDFFERLVDVVESKS